jgi:hypothetical protein
MKYTLLNVEFDIDRTGPPTPVAAALGYLRVALAERKSQLRHHVQIERVDDVEA